MEWIDWLLVGAWIFAIIAIVAAHVLSINQIKTEIEDDIINEEEK